MWPRTQLPAEFQGQIHRLGRSRYQQAGGHRDEERGHGSGKAIADREQRVDTKRLVDRHAMLQHSNRQATDKVDQRNDHARHGLPPNKPTGTVHAREEVSLPLEVNAGIAGLLAGEGAGLHLRVECHLSARQAVKRESGRDLTRPGGACGDHDELHNGNDRKHHAADHQVVGGHETTESFHHLTRRGRAVEGSPRKDQPRGRNIEHQPHEGGAEQEAREDAHLQRRLGGQGTEEGQHRHREVRREQQIDDTSRYRRQHDQHGQKNGRGERVVGNVGRQRPSENRS